MSFSIVLVTKLVPCALRPHEPSTAGEHGEHIALLQQARQHRETTDSDVDQAGEGMFCCSVQRAADGQKRFMAWLHCLNASVNTPLYQQIRALLSKTHSHSFVFEDFSKSLCASTGFAASQLHKQLHKYMCNGQVYVHMHAPPCTFSYQLLFCPIT